MNNKSNLANNLHPSIQGQRDLFYVRGNSGLNDIASHTTLPSDSSPFREKYEIDEDSEPLGEVSQNSNSETASRTNGLLRNQSDK